LFCFLLTLQIYNNNWHEQNIFNKTLHIIYNLLIIKPIIFSFVCLLVGNVGLKKYKIN